MADAQRVKGLAPLACKTDKVDARVLAELSFRDLVPAIRLPTPDGGAGSARTAVYTPRCQPHPERRHLAAAAIDWR